MKPPVEKMIHVRVSAEAHNYLKKLSKASKRSLSAQAAYELERLASEAKEQK